MASGDLTERLAGYTKDAYSAANRGNWTGTEAVIEYVYNFGYQDGRKSAEAERKAAVEEALEPIWRLACGLDPAPMTSNVPEEIREQVRQDIRYGLGYGAMATRLRELLHETGTTWP